ALPSRSLAARGPRGGRRSDVRVLRLGPGLAALRAQPPPGVRLGGGLSTLFQGVLTQLNQDLTFFMADGTPVRATLGCTFMAYQTFDEAKATTELHSADVAKRRLVRRGDTLASIAIEQYGDAARWRKIPTDTDIHHPPPI